MRQSPRESPAKSALSRDAVLVAGLRVLRAEGIDGVTMRRVAAELDTGPASLYVYVDNRKDLLDQMFDAVIGGVDLGDPPDPQRWRDQLTDVLTRFRRAMDEHPGIARVPLANVPTGPSATRGAEYVLALLDAGGVDERSAAWFVDVVFLYVNAAAYESAIYAEEGHEHESIEAELREDFGRLPPDEFPHFLRMLGLLTSGSFEARFAFALQLMINGLLSTEPPQP